MINLTNSPVDPSRNSEYLSDTGPGGGFHNPTAQGYKEWLVNHPDGQANSTESGNPAQSVEPEPTLSQYMSENPDLGYEDYLRYMSQHSEEWAEKYLDYLTERGELDRANEYTASREDTAYQRLVEDLRKAGLNPAMMYGSSASISAGGSQGYVKMTEGANNRAVGNYKKIQDVLIKYMMYELAKELGIANTVFKGISAIFNPLSALIG